MIWLQIPMFSFTVQDSLTKHENRNMLIPCLQPLYHFMGTSTFSEYTVVHEQVRLWVRNSFLTWISVTLVGLLSLSAACICRCAAQAKHRMSWVSR